MKRMKPQIQISLILFFLILGGLFSQSFANEEQTESSDSSEINRACNCVAFRLDDVQDFWLNEVQKKIIETYYERETPLTIGVIGNSFGEDEKLLNSINVIIESEFELEIANHGWQHEDFSKHTKEEQSELLRLSNQSIHESFGISPTIFIPPMNYFNTETLRAMEENGIILFSSELDESKDAYGIDGSSTLHFPESASTGVLNKKKILFEGLASEATFLDIQASLDVYGFAVVTLHPQEFSTIKNGTYSNSINHNQMRELNFLIDEIEKNGYKVVLLSQIMENSKIIEINSEEIPSWSNTYADFWSKGKISDNQFAKGLNHLEKIGIIQISDIQTPKDHNFEAQIPSWIKNNARWWSNGLISDKEFVNSIQYLISEKIIKV